MLQPSPSGPLPCLAHPMLIPDGTREGAVIGAPCRRVRIVTLCQCHRWARRAGIGGRSLVPAAWGCSTQAANCARASPSAPCLGWSVIAPCRAAIPLGFERTDQAQNDPAEEQA